MVETHDTIYALGAFLKLKLNTNMSVFLRWKSNCLKTMQCCSDAHINEYTASLERSDVVRGQSTKRSLFQQDLVCLTQIFDWLIIISANARTSFCI